MVTDSSRLDGQVAIVTGAAQGIGRGIALVLAEAGAAIVIGDIQDQMNSQKKGGGRQAEHWYTLERRRDPHLTLPQCCPTDGVHLTLWQLQQGDCASADRLRIRFTRRSTRSFVRDSAASSGLALLMRSRDSDGLREL